MLAVISQGTEGAPSLLDVGCGFGGLLDHARSKGIELDYTGIDVAENMIQWAQESFPDTAFICDDVLDTEFGPGVPALSLCRMQEGVGTIADLLGHCLSSSLQPTSAGIH